MMLQGTAIRKLSCINLPIRRFREILLISSLTNGLIWDLPLLIHWAVILFDKTGTLIETDGSQEKSYNLPIYALDRWQKPGDITDVPVSCWIAPVRKLVPLYSQY